MSAAIRRNAGIVEQVRTALRREYRLATFVGVLLGAIVPLITFAVAHVELSASSGIIVDGRWLLVAGGLLFSAKTVYTWGCLALGSRLKALGFTVLLEGTMVASEQTWLAVTALAYLIGINAIATGVTLARGEPTKEAPAEPKTKAKR